MVVKATTAASVAAPAATARAGGARPASGEGAQSLLPRPRVAELVGVPAPASTPIPLRTTVVRGETAADAAFPTAVPAHASGAARLTAAGKQVPMANGGVGPGYWWTQTLSEVTLYAMLPPATRAKDVQCVVTPTSVRIGLRGVAPLVAGAFPGAVRHADSVWSLDAEPERPRGGGGEIGGGGGVLLALALDKVVPTWWTSALRGDPEIDGSLINSTVPMGEYDDETQAAIRKIMFDQAQKVRGQPSSDELALAAAAEAAGINIERAATQVGSSGLPSDGSRGTAGGVPPPANGSLPVHVAAGADAETQSATALPAAPDGGGAAGTVAPR